MNYLKNLQKSDEFDYWQGANTAEILAIETALNVKLPIQYKKFLAECGMCNCGDVNIFGVAKDDTQLTYPVIEMTKELRNEANLEPDFIVIGYEIGEYVTLHQVSQIQVLEDAPIFGMEVMYDGNEKIQLGKKEKLFPSFKAYFADFLELGL